jgi:hypothetical protein
MLLLRAALFSTHPLLQRGLRFASVLMYLSARHSTYLGEPGGLLARYCQPAGRPIRGRARGFSPPYLGPALRTFHKKYAIWQT